MIARMFKRQLQSDLIEALRRTAAVALLGPRQVGKTTLALAVAEALRGERPFLYLDLESEADRARLAQPELYLAPQADKLVILDEVHRLPGLFPVLRGLIDSGRRSGANANGRFLLLGSASLDLLAQRAQSGESLAGRIRYLELAPLTVDEVDSTTATALSTALWLRGGFALSLLAHDDRASLQWRLDFIRTYIEREALQFRARLNAPQLRRMWTMLAHQQGGMLNVAALARSLGVDGKTAAGFIDLLEQLLLVRRLMPWHANVGKRLVKSPKAYVRDSGLLHALLGIADEHTLLGHPVLGASWETWAIENLLAAGGPHTQAWFYRTAAGAEVDLLLQLPDGQTWAVEIKRSLTPKLERGFHEARTDLAPQRCWLVYPGEERWPLSQDVEALPLAALMAELRAAVA